jgi:predicted DNA-binding protein (MmcQ/YjbR family)
MFALVDLEVPLSINIKCNPEKAIELREQYACVIPGYHMNKKHWNSILIDGSIPYNSVLEWITDSYNIVFNSLPKTKRQMLINNHNFL